MDREEHISRTHLYKLFPNGCPVPEDEWIWVTEKNWVDRLGANDDSDETKRMFRDAFKDLVGYTWRVGDGTPVSLKYDLFEAYGIEKWYGFNSAFYVNQFKQWYEDEYYGYLYNIGM